MSEAKRLREAFEAGEDWRLMVDMLSPDEYAKEKPDAHEEALRRYPDSPEPSNVREIIVDFCKREGYDGLYFARGNCQCQISKLQDMSCEVPGFCRPGVLVGGKIVEKGIEK